MVRWGKRCRRLRRRNNSVRAELTAMRTVVGQDAQAVQEVRRREAKMKMGLSMADELQAMLTQEVRDRESFLATLENRLEKVPHWVRWMFKAV